MTILKRFLSSRAAVRTVVAGVVLAGFWVTAVAQAPKAPYALFNQALLTGSGNTVTAANIPVVTASGAVVYQNATLQFNVDANGNLSMAPGFPQFSPAPVVLTSTFRAGTYVGPSTIQSGKATITISGPGVTAGGATMWSLSTATGASSGTYPSTANWYVGPVANNPQSARLTKAGITSTSLSYGVGGGGTGPSYWWQPGSLLGFSQTGNALTVYSFTGYEGVDSATPQDQITYTLVTN